MPGFGLGEWERRAGEAPDKMCFRELSLVAD